MDQKKVNLGKAIVMKQFMDDEMAAYAVQEAEGALECIFQERVSHSFNHHFKLRRVRNGTESI